MDWQFSPYIIPLSVGVLIILGLIVTVVQRRNVLGIWPMLFICVAALIYTAGYIFELSSANLPAIKFWIRVRIPGNCLHSGCHVCSGDGLHRAPARRASL